MPGARRGAAGHRLVPVRRAVRRRLLAGRRAAAPGPRSDREKHFTIMFIKHIFVIIIVIIILIIIIIINSTIGHPHARACAHIRAATRAHAHETRDP